MWIIIILIGVFVCLFLLWRLISSRSTPTSLAPSETTPLLQNNAKGLTLPNTAPAGQEDFLFSAENNIPSFDIPGFPSLKKQNESWDFEGAQDDYMDVICENPDFMAAKQEDDVMSEKEILFLLQAIKYSRLMSSIKDENILRDIVKTMTKINVKNGDVVIQQGDTNGRKYYVMESGAVDVFVFDQFRVTIQPGWCFGELSFVFGAPRSASCIAGSSSTANDVTVLWELDRTQFDRIMCGQAPLERMRITRQQSDPMRVEDDSFDDEEELTKRALHQIYGSEFFENQDVRILSKGFLEQLLDRDYIGVPEQIALALQEFKARGTDLQFDLKTRKIIEVEAID